MWACFYRSSLPPRLSSMFSRLFLKSEEGTRFSSTRAYKTSWFMPQKHVNKLVDFSFVCVLWSPRANGCQTDEKGLNIFINEIPLALFLRRKSPNPSGTHTHTHTQSQLRAMKSDRNHWLIVLSNAKQQKQHHKTENYPCWRFISARDWGLRDNRCEGFSKQQQHTANRMSMSMLCVPQQIARAIHASEI